MAHGEITFTIFGDFYFTAIGNFYLTINSYFLAYHTRFPSHGYRWLNAKIRLDLGIVYSDEFARRCCAYMGLKSQSKHYKYKVPGEPRKTYPNLILASLRLTGPLQCVVSDMTAFWAAGRYWELTLYMDLWNNEC